MNSLTAAWAMRSKRPATVLIIQLPRRSSESQPYTAGTSGHFSIERNTISSIGPLVCSKSNPPDCPAPNEARGFHLRPQPAGALGGSRPAGRGLQRALFSLLRRRRRGISELQSLRHLVCRLLLEKKKTITSSVVRY